MGQFHWDPETYLELMHSEVPDYERLQDEVARACAVPPLPVRAMLELGTGTGQTTGRVLRVQPDAELIGIDESRGMLDAARTALPTDRTTLTLARLEDALPPGPFQLVFSALAVHHLHGPAKAALFERVAAVLPADGRFVLGDVVVPVDPADVVTPIDDGHDKPSSLADQLGWLEAAGFTAAVAWAHRDLAVIVGDRAA